VESRSVARCDADGARPSGCDDSSMFLDRRQAGRLLAQLLERFARERPVVLALPRGGVPVAVEVAGTLRAPLDVLAVRKLGAPGNPEFAVGAIAEDGTTILDDLSARRAGMSSGVLAATVARETSELRRCVSRYRCDRPLIDLDGRCVIIVDDGLATGLTGIAAVRAVRALGAAKVIVAVPVGARRSVGLLADEADELVCHTVPRELIAVGAWYEDFSPVSDGEVVRLIGLARDKVQAAERADPPLRREVVIETAEAALACELAMPLEPTGLVIFAHAAGSSRRSPANRVVAAALGEAGFATLLVDLVNDAEARRRDCVFNTVLLAQRLESVTLWALEASATQGLPIGYFGASTGAAAALRAAVRVGDAVRSVVVRGGRPDLAADCLMAVRSPTLLIVGGLDHEVLRLNREAAGLLNAPHRLVVVDNASHLFGEPGKLEIVGALACDWFAASLSTDSRALVAAGS